jgi:hypothetical protein
MLPTILADRLFEPRAIPTLRLGAADADIMLWSGCSEIGTGSSNSPRSANESLSLRTLPSRQRNSARLRRPSAIGATYPLTLNPVTK